MISFFIDTATNNAVLGLIKDNTLLAQISVKTNSDLGASVFSFLDKLFKDADIKPTDVDKIFVVNGPGSFTGIRIGVTIAKVYAWALHKDVISISSLEVLASTDVKENVIIPLIDARRGYVYAGFYDTNLNTIKNDQYMSFTEILNEYKDAALVSYDKLNHSIIEPQVNIIKVINKHLNDKPINPHELNPEYLKKTEAEINREMHD